MSNLTEKIDRLPATLRREAEDYVDYLLERKVPSNGGVKSRPLTLSWAGALKDLGRQGITARQLKKEALNQMADRVRKGTSTDKRE